MRVTLLGTGGSTGVPGIGGSDGTGDWGVCDPAEPRNRRTRSSILIESDGHALLIDTSPDMRAQLLAARVRRIDSIMFTHAHADHILGLDDVRSLNKITGKAIDIFATEETEGELRRRFDYAFRPWDGGAFFRPVLAPHQIHPGDTVQIGGMLVQVFEQDHKVLPTLGLRAGGFAYSTDAVVLSDAALATLAGVDTWVVGCFQRRTHYTHAWIGRVLDWIERIHPRRTVLTHMGTDMDWKWLQSNLPAGVEPGYDGLVLEIE